MGKKASERIEEVTWEQVRRSVQAVNPQLAAIIDKFNPEKAYSFIKVRYFYGDKILQKGELQLPSGNGLVSLNQTSTELQKKLGYSSVPMGLILSRSVEVFFETSDRVMPSKLFDTGTMFGLWEAYDPAPSEFVKKVWNLTAGARLAFMLAKISDAVSHDRLRRDYAIHAYLPKSLLDHYKIFMELAHKDGEKEDGWHCDILFFVAKWQENKEDNISSLRLHKYWLEEAWRQSFNCRNQMSYDVAWEEFSKEVTRRNYKPRAYIINTIKHLLTLGEGIYPGFVPALSNEVALPVRLIQDAYMKGYLLKKYAPIIMTPHHLRNKGEFVYYSLSLPTQLEYAPQAKNSPSIMNDMRELKMLMQILQESIKEKTVNYEFFHSEEDRFGEIRHSSELPDKDPRLISMPAGYNNQDKWFCDNSPFWRGCIRIQRLI